MLLPLISGVSEHDKEGRVITAEYEKFFLVTSCKINIMAYQYLFAMVNIAVTDMHFHCMYSLDIPNSGQGLKR
jgi:hypothetical protein